MNREFSDEDRPVDSPIFDAMLDRGALESEDLLERTSPAISEALVDLSASLAASAAANAAADDPAPPDAAARDAARRKEAGPVDDTLHADEFDFVTRDVSAEDRAAVIAVLTQVRTEETRRVRRVERREHEPWARSQRVPEGIGELLADG